MHLKTDEHIPASAVALLRSAGHDVLTAIDEDLGGTPDPELLARCRAESRAFLTLDLGLADIRAYPPAEYAGIVVLRLRDQRIASVIDVLRRILPLLAAESLAGRLWIVDERRVRVRQ